MVACEDTRHTRVLLERYGVSATLVSYHEHNERARAAELVERMRGGAVVALVSDAGMPLVSDPGYVLVQGCVAAGLAVEVLPGPSAALDRAGGERAAGRRAGASPASCRASAGALEAVLARAGDGRRVRVAAPRRRVAGGARRARPRAPGRGLPRADEAARGDRARHGGRARRALRATRRRAARSCSSSAARRARTGVDPAAVDAVRRLVEAGARAARRPPASSPSSPGRRRTRCIGGRRTGVASRRRPAACAITSCANRSLKPEHEAQPGVDARGWRRRRAATTTSTMPPSRNRQTTAPNAGADHRPHEAERADRLLAGLRPHRQAAARHAVHDADRPRRPRRARHADGGRARRAAA